MTRSINLLGNNMNQILRDTNSKKIFIANRKGGNITLNDVGKDKSVYLLNVSQANVNIKGKINNLYLEKCDCLDIFTESIINKFDSFRCGYIYFENKNEVNTILAEQVINLDMRLHNIDNIDIVLMSTYNAELFHVPYNTYIPVKFGMFSDRFKTSFVGGKPLITRL